jgi:hypothetical protein
MKEVGIIASASPELARKTKPQRSHAPPEKSNSTAQH